MVSGEGIRCGVLALQGSSAPHAERLQQLGVEPVLVRRTEHLAGLTHLIIPGGESTTIHHLLALFELTEAIVDRYRQGTLSLFGTCAGAILLGHSSAAGERPPRWGLLDAVVDRNAYGTQLDSFTCDLTVPLLGEPPLHAVFIRAPIIQSVGPAARVLAEHGGHPVLVEAPGLLAATFHPELTEDVRVHERFLLASRAPDPVQVP